MLVRSIQILVLVVLLAPAGVRALDMPLTDMYGNQANLKAYEGKWVVVNYWATWCPPCITEMPELQDFHDAHADRDAVVIGINIEHISRSRLEAFLDDYFITYSIFVSPPTQKSELGLIPGLPTTFMVSPEGKVMARQIGPVTRDMLEQFMDKQNSQ